jgi:hypothetical protein
VFVCVSAGKMISRFIVVARKRLFEIIITAEEAKSHEWCGRTSVFHPHLIVLVFFGFPSAAQWRNLNARVVLPPRYVPLKRALCLLAVDNDARVRGVEI